MIPKVLHIHKLKRLKYKSGNSIFFCSLPDCSFKINTALALGKRSICWRCEESFIMNDYSIRLAKPHCDNCHKSKKEVTETITTVTSNDLSSKLQQAIQKAQAKEREGEI